MKTLTASELRIGNIYFDTYDKKEKALSLNDMLYVCNYELMTSRDLRFEAIPLTEEWLIKLEFKMWESGSCFIKKYNHQGDFILFDHRTPVAISNGVKDGEFYYMFHQTIHTIKHVHQLQNLYFALTGEELTIKEIVPA